MNIREAVEKKKQELVTKKAELDFAKRQQEEIVKEMATLGVNPETIDAEILKLTGEVDEFEDKATKLMVKIEEVLDEVE